MGLHKKRLLHTHHLFPTARTARSQVISTRHEGIRGTIASLNLVQERPEMLDDPDDLMGEDGRWSCWCCPRETSSSQQWQPDQSLEMPLQLSTEQQSQRRTERERFLIQVEASS